MIYELLSSLIFCPVTDGRTDRQKVMHKSPPCMGTKIPFLLLGSVGASGLINLSKRIKSLLVSTTYLSILASLILLKVSMWARAAPKTNDKIYLN